MKKSLKILIAILVILMLTLNYTMVFAEPPEKPSGDGQGQNGGTPPDKPDGEMSNQNGENPPDKPDGDGGSPGENGGSSNISHTGATEISSDTNNNGTSYSSTTGSQNALLVTGGTSTISNPIVTKSGDSDGDNSDFYGTNAAVLVKEGTLNINGGTVTTEGSHANGVFAYLNGIINITDTTIKTTNNNSGAIMVTGGGTLTANNVTAETDGNSSAPIRSDRGGGTLTVNGGNYTSHGTGSPAVYSTANITVNDANLTSTASEGVVVEGKNSVTLNNTILEATNTELNGNSETYKSIFIYQSMSGDADVGTSSFTAKDSKIINNKGDIIFVTNTSTVIELENNEIINNDPDGAFINISSGKWGTSGKNGGEVVLNATNQNIEGDILVDNISTLDLSLKNGSSYSGTINSDNTAKTISVKLDSSSSLTLTGDSYITSLDNEVEDNSNINLNGYTLYVDGTAISSTNYTGASAESKKDETTNDNQKIDTKLIVLGALVGLLVIIGAITIILKRKK
ncbi:MAG: hypothetical protein IKG42_04030 [Clostridia bacterium]|nr:hypothetical protein [Clostridia bacterium]